MAFCMYCGNALPEGARFCPSCGKQQSVTIPTSTAASDPATHDTTISFPASSNGSRNTAPLPQPVSTEEVHKEEKQRGVLIEEKKAELSAQRAIIGSNLRALLPFVAIAHREKNKNLFESAATNPPSLEDGLWANIAYVTGVYGKIMSQHPLNSDQRLGMWQALVWAVWYERCFRTKMIDQRLQELMIFLKKCLGDAAFLTDALDDLESLVDVLNLANLKKMRDALSEATSTPKAAQLREKLDERIAKAPVPPSTQSTQAARPDTEVSVEQVIPAIESLWGFLDRRLETENRAIVNAARRGPQTLDVIQRLAHLAGVISGNVAYRYTHGGNLSGEQLLSTILLATFSAHHSRDRDRFLKITRQHLSLLEGLERMRTHSLDPALFINELQQEFGTRDQGESTNVMSELIATATHYLAEQRQAGVADRVEAEAWVRAFSTVEGLSPTEREQFVAEVKKHGVANSIALQRVEAGSQGEHGRRQEQGPLAFLGEERRKEFLESIRNNRLVRMREILRESRQSLLSALSRVLAVQSFQEIQPPQRSIRIRGRNTADQFPEARRLIMSQDINQQKKALSLFEQAVRETSHRDFVHLAREWLLFAQARVHGAFMVVADWEEDRKVKTSWEEIWNLAGFYVQMGEPARALNVLKPGVEQLKAPFSHLRFALYCAVQILEQSRQNKETTEVAMRFLVAYLTKLPLLECYLAWLLLVDEAQLEIDLIEQMRVLGGFQGLLDHPINILRTEQQPDDAVAEAFGKELQSLKLEDTWRLWLNDYTRLHPYHYRGWQWLSEASERVGDMERAEGALTESVNHSLNQYQQQQRRGVQEPNVRYLRLSLIKLFEFYRRNALQSNSKVAFNRYYKMIPQLWDGKDVANNLLIGLTRPYLEETLITSPAAPAPVAQPGGSANMWSFLQADLAAVRDVAGLKRLQERLNTAIDLLPSGQKVVRDRVVFIKGLLAEVCTLDATEWRREQLLREVDRLNRAIQDAYQFVEQEAALRPLKALVSALERVFSAFSDAQRLPPDLQVDPEPLGSGLPNDVSETALVLRISNPGPGEVTALQVTCSDKGVIASRREGLLDRLPEHGEDIVAVPVNVRYQPGHEQVDCRINLTYQWGIMKELTSSHLMSVRWFAFRDFLQQHGVNAYELPIPYVFDTPIDFTKHDPRLFQGREGEIELIRTVFIKGQMTGTPLYFHGIRKVGKTSLLHRLALELKENSTLRNLADLHIINGPHQTLRVIINSFTDRILRNASEQGLDVGGINPNGVDHPNPLVAVEPFFEALRERAKNRRLVLLLDEFQVIVAQVTTPLLDLLRRVHQRGLVWFIMSGWMRPETMRRICPDTQLFPLSGRPVDFLSKEVVKRVLHAPIADLGVEIPDTTVEHVYMQTAGNPYHVAKLAWYGIARLNAEHRTVMAPQDVDEIASLLAGDPANFTSSSFSPQILTPEEQGTAIAFAKALPEQQDLMPMDNAFKMFNVDIIQQLEEKYILELQGDQIKIKSKMLATYLRQRIAEPLEINQPARPGVSRRVGLFVDVENVWHLASADMSPKAFGLALTEYAARYGEVVSRWACADPRNLPDPTGMRLGLEEAGFNVRFPRGELQKGMRAKNVTDFVLLEAITDERDHSQPDVYIIASGDQDFYEKIVSLIDSGFTVRLLASRSNQHLSSKYPELEEQRRSTRFAEGFTESDFFIDNLDEILSKPSSRVS